MIVAVDFDGTLCVNVWPEIGAPRMGVIEYVKQRRRGGDRIILWTNRSGEQLRSALSWCSELGLEFDAVNENLPDIIAKFGSDCRKVYADEYVDDKARRPEDVERSMRFRRTVRRGK